MAREYNKKYSTNNYATVLNNNNLFLLDRLREIFTSIFKLYNNLKVTFKKYNEFNSFFSKAESILLEIENFFEENNFGKLTINSNEVIKPVNHKFCALSMLDIYINIFKLNAEVLHRIDELKNCLLLNNYNNIDNEPLNSLNEGKLNSLQGEDFNSVTENNECFLEKNKKDIEDLIEKLYKLQEIFITFTENLKDFYSIVN